MEILLLEIIKIPFETPYDAWSDNHAQLLGVMCY